jgi:rod shape-determining protein MreC
VVGYSEDLCTLNYVLKTEELVLGDIIVSSGINGIYPKGIFIGTVTSINKDKSGFFQFVEIKPSVDFTKLNEVLIVLKEKDPGAADGT